jgi:hypothetical protein
MKKRILVSLVLLTFVTAGAAFAQSPTLDKLTLTARGSGNNGYYEVKALNTSISGAVVIPDTYNNRPVKTIPTAAFRDCSKMTSVTIPTSVTSIGSENFRGCTSLTSVTFPASVTSIGIRAFFGCTNLNSVTFQGTAISVVEGTANGSFPGDLAVAYKAGGAGTYTRPANGNNWTKQGAASAPAPAVNTSLDGWWAANSGLTIIVSGNTATFLYFGTSALAQDALNKGYVKSGDLKLRNIRSTGNLTWTMQELAITYNARSPNVATGTSWENATLTMSANGQTLSENGSVRWTREVPHQ